MSDPSAPLPTLTIPPGTAPIDIKRLATDFVNQLVPPENHVAIIAIATKDSAGNVSARLAAAQRVNSHLQFHEDLVFAHSSTGNGWAGEMSMVAVF